MASPQPAASTGSASIWAESIFRTTLTLSDPGAYLVAGGFYFTDSGWLRRFLSS
jgi:hypothetical protein